jgi:hypothetical protein
MGQKHWPPVQSARFHQGLFDQPKALKSWNLIVGQDTSPQPRENKSTGLKKFTGGGRDKGAIGKNCAFAPMKWMNEPVHPCLLLSLARAMGRFASNQMQSQGKIEHQPVPRPELPKNRASQSGGDRKARGIFGLVP